MSDLTKNQKKDYRNWFNEKADPSFVKRHNDDVVSQVIKETEENIKRKSRQYTEKLRERTDAVATYLKSIAAGKEKSVDKYFGKKNLAQLRGEQIIEMIKGKTKVLSDIKN